jgi:hypothetical protein
MNFREELMKKVVKVVLLIILGAVLMRATCGKPKPTEETTTIKAKEMIKITDKVYYHNMSITYDGEHYYTINGGNTGYSVINEYDGKGKFVTKYNVGLDGRAIFYNPDDYELYVKIYGTDLCKIDLENEDYSTELSGIFTNEQSSIGFSPVNNLICELNNGTVTTYDISSGDTIDTYDLDKYSTVERFNCSMAASNEHMFVWGSNPKEVLIYNLEGIYQGSVILPRPGFGYSLSYCNGLLWIAQDADAKDKLGKGTWYGYQLQGLE